MKNLRVEFGKYRGKTVLEVVAMDRDHAIQLSNIPGKMGIAFREVLKSDIKPYDPKQSLDRAINMVRDVFGQNVKVGEIEWEYPAVDA